MKAARQFILLVSLITLLMPTKSRSASENQTKLNADKEQQQLSLIENQEEKPAKKVKLIIRVVVPHNKQPVDKFDLYPYPIEPRKNRHPAGLLPTDPHNLKDVLYGMGYTARTSLDDPYPANGWRMQYAFKSAVRKSNLALPHGYVEVNSWRDAMRPYLLEEVLKSNAFEKQRRARCAAAEEEFKETRTEIEMEALKQGLYPIYVYVRQGRGISREGYAMVDQATWWVAGTHRVPGLTYYWQEKVKLTDAPEQIVDLNEDNALYVEGGW